MKTRLLLLFLFVNSAIFAQPSCPWAYMPVGPSQTYNTIFITTVDNSGNIIEVGKILGSADMNPAPGPADTSFTAGGYNWYISNTSVNGNLIWIRYFQNNSQIAFFEFKGLKVNSANEIVVVGNYYGMVDFDLSDSGVDTLRSHFPSYPDYFVAKYDSSCNFKWAMNIGDATTNNIDAQAVTILPNDNIVVAANPTGTVDVDPDVAIHNSTGSNANLICYDSNGNHMWNNNITNPTSYAVPTQSLVSDGLGSSYVFSVGYYELTATRFDVNGSLIWEKTIGDFSSNARVDPQSVLIDKVTSEFYVAGTFGGTVDFNPGPAVVNKTSSSGFFQDGFIAKYDQYMNLLWVNTYVGEVSFGDYSLDFDGPDLVTAGGFTGTVDFGNGFQFTSSVNSSPFYLKIDASGNTLDGFALNGAGKYYTLNTLPNQAFITSGNISNNTDMDPSNGTLTLNTSMSNFFTAVYQASGTTSINKSEFNHEFSVYPNPVVNRINLYTDEKHLGSDYSICDVTNKIVRSGKIKNANTIIDLTGLNSGIYILNIANGNKIRLVKE